MAFGTISSGGRGLFLQTRFVLPFSFEKYTNKDANSRLKSHSLHFLPERVVNLPLPDVNARIRWLKTICCGSGINRGVYCIKVGPTLISWLLAVSSTPHSSFVEE